MCLPPILAGFFKKGHAGAGIQGFRHTELASVADKHH